MLTARVQVCSKVQDAEKIFFVQMYPDETARLQKTGASCSSASIPKCETWVLTILIHRGNEN